MSGNASIHGLPAKSEMTCFRYVATTASVPLGNLTISMESLPLFLFQQFQITSSLIFFFTFIGWLDGGFE
jgi:hypothetical protein